jgi:uncharacterized protein YkwD
MVAQPERRRTWVVAAAACAAVAAAMPARAAAVDAQLIAAEIRDCANGERAKHGLGPLVENHVLDEAAAFHARNMARYDFSEHVDPWGRGPAERVDLFGSAAAFRIVGENLAAGEQSVAEACADWMRSSGHRANILDPAFHSIGAGFAIGHTALRYYFVQTFGATNPGGARSARSRRRPRGPRVVVRLSEAGDQLTLRLDGLRVAMARRGQSLEVPLGRIRPRARITVEARSVSGDLSWSIEELSDGKRAYSDTRPGTPEPTTVVDLATAGPPLIHRVTLDARGHVLGSFTSRRPAASVWGEAGAVGRVR